MSTDENVVHGTIHVQLFGPDGELKYEEELHNKITDAGDLYQATRIAAGVNTNGVAQPTLVNGMKLGSGNTAESKNGAGAALVTYIAGSNKTFDSGYPQITNLGSGLGVSVVYQASWAAGIATSVTINEVVIVNDAATNATSTAANTIARGVFSSTISKGAADTLLVTWTHKQLGA